MCCSTFWKSAGCQGLLNVFCLIGFLALPLRNPAQEANGSENQDSPFLSKVRQITYDGRRSGEGYFSPEGEFLIFQSERTEGNPFYQIYMMNLDSGETHRVSPGLGKTTCAFFRPGTDRVLFSSTHHDPNAKTKQREELDFRASGKSRRYSWDYDPEMEIYSANREGTDLKRLTEAKGYDAEASYSPDGQLIAFSSLRHVYPSGHLSEEERKRLEMDPSYFADLYVMNADGSDVMRLTDWPGYDGGPFFSPEGGSLVWRRFDETGAKAEIYIMELDGKEPREVRRVTDFECMSWAPYYHPSGEYIIFAANKEGFSNFELYLVDVKGGREPVRVTWRDGFDGLPVFSPDGTQLSWTSNRTSDENSQLFLAEWDHSAALASLEKISPPEQSKPGRSSKQSTAEISKEELRAHVEKLASDALEGRLTGTQGARLAAEYIAENLERIGLQAFESLAGYYQPFDFTSGVEIVPGKNSLMVVDESKKESLTRDFEIDKDFRPLALTANDTVEGPVVFAGYGLKVPGQGMEAYNSYANLDVTNKIVMVLRYVPEDVSVERRQELNRYAALRYKAMIAREEGAKGILVVTGPNSPLAGELAPLTFDTSLAGSGIVAASITDEAAEMLLAPSGKTLKELQTALDRENPHAAHGLPLPHVSVKLSTEVEAIKKQDRNVIGYIPPGGSTENPSDQPFLVLGAHYDHLGYGKNGSSRRTSTDEELIHNGADDNASGVALLLELAEKLERERMREPERFKHGVLFGFWSGEELGLIGSSHFVEHSPVDKENIHAYLNFDMVGRLRENKLSLQGIGSSSDWKSILERRNVPVGFQLNLQEDPYLPTDVVPFYTAEIPILAFFTGSHEDYHRPTDDPDTLNYEGLERVTRLAYGVVRGLMERSEPLAYSKVEQSRHGGSRDSLRAYLGTIPDYTTEVEGVKLSGVREGGPADNGGVKGGDVVVKLAGQEIKNIYDYTYALDAVKIGEPTEIAVMRDGERVTLTVVPEARE